LEDAQGRDVGDDRDANQGRGGGGRRRGADEEGLAFFVVDVLVGSLAKMSKGRGECGQGGREEVGEVDLCIICKVRRDMSPATNGNPQMRLSTEPCGKGLGNA
jgi:hypothetical protein